MAQEALEGYRLSPQQKRLWLLRKDGLDARAWIVLRLEEGVDRAALRRGVERLVERHEILRTGFRSLSGMELPMQVVTDHGGVSWGEPRLGEGDGETKARELLAEERCAAWNREAGPALHATLVELPAGGCFFQLWLPALCADLASLRVLVAELFEGEVEVEEDDEPLQYCQFSEWLNQDIEDPESEPARAFWRRQEVFPPPRSLFAVGQQARGDEALATARLEQPLAATTVVGLERLADRLELAPETLCLAAWQVLLWRLTGETKALVGRLFPGRDYEELEQAVGLFSRCLPVLTRPEAGRSFAEHAAALETDEAEVEGQEDGFHPEYGKALVEGRPGVPYFPFGFEGRSRTLLPRTRGGKVEVIDLQSCVDVFDLLLAFVHGDGEARLELVYDPDRFDRATVARFGDRLAALLAAALAEPGQPIDALPLLGTVERQELLLDFNRTAEPALEEDPSPSESVVRWARERPGAVAVELGDDRLTYAELDAAANRLAHALRDRGATAERVVGVCLPRSPELLVALLGVLRSGAAYLPLDPDFPGERLAYMLEDAGAELVIAGATTAARLSALGGERVFVDPHDPELARQPADPVASEASRDSLAYVMYTSGSTGLPKGVMISRAGLTSYLEWCARTYGLEQGEGSLLHSSVAFDLTVTSLFAPLARGRKVKILEEGLGVDALIAALVEGGGRLSLLKLSPAHLRVLRRQLGEAPEGGWPGGLVVGGEALFYDDFAWWREQTPEGRLWNEYGPTEAVVGCCVHEVPAGELGQGAVPIGRPISNASLYVVDGGLRLLPRGQSGELMIGGAGLARGYHARPALTAERFVPNPFASEPGERLYHSGDRVRFRADGELEYLGRGDDQVKIRGYRVELGEVEATLGEHPGVEELVCMAPEDEEPGARRLVAYAVPKKDAAAPTSSEDLYRFSREQLPDFMVPSTFILLAKLPLTAHGKVDRQALLEELRIGQQATGETAAATAEEEILAGICANVLGLDEVGVGDNFFTIGGDSIRAIEVVAQAQERGLFFNLDDLFNNPTIRQLARKVSMEEASVDAEIHTEPFSLVSPEIRAQLPAGLEDAYPLTRLQAGMIFHAELDPESAAYHDITSIHLRAPFHAELLRQALADLVACHPTLRTSFNLTDFAEPLQLVHERGFLPLEVEDISHLSPAEQGEAVLAWLRAEEKRAFDYGRLPLMRYYVHLRSPESFQVSISFQHAILDGWSDATMLSELFNHYLSLLRGEAAELLPTAVTFRDFIALERQAIERDQPYWEAKLEGSTALRLPRWRTAEGQGKRNIQVRTVRFGEEVSEGLKRLALQLAVPLKNLLLAGHLRVLGLVTGQDDVLTSLVSSGRPETAGGTRVMGLFINAMPFRKMLSGGSWRDLVLEVFEEERELLPFRRYPAADAQWERGGRLTEVLFYFTHYHIFHGLSALDGIEVLDYYLYEETSFPLTVNFYRDPMNDSVNVKIKYDEGELSTPQIEAMAGYYQRTFEVMVRDPEARYESADLLSVAESQARNLEWGGNEAEAADATLLDLFAARLREAPEAEAIATPSRRLTYGELDRWANQLAHVLRQRGVGLEDRVALCLERSPEMLVALLAVLKAGGAYLPLDPAYPEGRLAFMLEDGKVSLLITQSSLVDRLPEGTAARLVLDEIGAALEAVPDTAPAAPPGPRNLAYMIYTSGSTGLPKGVQIEHRALANFLTAMGRRFPLVSGDTLLAVTTLSFDIAGLELYLPLTLGARVVLATTAEAADSSALMARIEDSGARLMQATPATWSMLLDSGWQGRPDLRILCGGEALPQKLADRLHGAGAEVWNLYGPTETTIWSMCERLAEGEGVTLGRRIDATVLRVVDSALRPVPMGAPGELLIGGAGLARGYWQRPALTAERFVPDALSGARGGRLYRTGDRVRTLPDTRLEFLERLDDQVKVRGFRIELGEIAAVLAEHAAVARAVAVVREDAPGDRRLVAYWIPAGSERPTTSELRAALAQRLPEYMLPAAFVDLQEMPLTPAGKVDRRALPAPSSERPELDRPYLAPRSGAEASLATIWADLLRRDQVGIEDNFFELGGDSIISVQVAARAAREGLRIKPRQIFEHPTIATLAALAEERSEVSAEQGAILGEAPLTPDQQAFFALDLPRSEHHNRSLLIDLGADSDPRLLEQAWSRVLGHHDALRSSFTGAGEEGLQRFGPLPEEAPLRVCDLADLEAEEQEREMARLAEEAQAGLDLSSGALWRVLWIGLGERRSSRLLIVLHSLLADRASWRLLLADLATVYRQLRDGQEVVLPPKTSSLKRWSERLSELDDGETGRAVASEKPLPMDFEGLVNTVGEAETIEVRLSEEETRGLLQEAPRAYRNRVEELLLTAWLEAFGEWTGEPRLTIDVEVQGREDLGGEMDLARTVGAFACNVPVHLDATSAKGPGELLTAVKETVRAMPQGGLGLLLGQGEAPRPRVAFRYLGPVDGQLTGTLGWHRATGMTGAERPAEQPRRHLIDLEGRIAEGRLVFALTFGQQAHARATMEALAGSFLAALQRLIEHCRSPEAGALSPSDFTRTRLTGDKLAKILAEVERA